ncbi:hypothetical protein [Novosphingobium nitrogenifigens]|uniref:hypothetical protein n=1 Tax=Novosphingobium nitrogenifigens TaxID=378548 RepID=UPI001E4BA332|nr:hypothetical protein [Novosphingobium nitrogenifigens]
MALAQASQSPKTQASAPPKAGTYSLPTEDVDDSSKQSAALAQSLLTPTKQPPRCDDSGGGISVCGHKEDSSKIRLPLRDELESSRATGDGVPRAPDVFGIKKGTISIGLCLMPPCKSEALPTIDFSKMPADPEGSDADRIGKGEIRAF